LNGAAKQWISMEFSTGSVALGYWFDRLLMFGSVVLGIGLLAIMLYNSFVSILFVAGLVVMLGMSCIQ
jgi:hypothetical protein